ncbi:hypothetical protein Golob_027680 [Gossypium lobatum]|uniref:Methyltransferase n=1 Tax=Gossypium lobatum TaxID=34289 RepID=A0A7J8NF26_9ROSI|nr:hypothetical protein [Gossypium lobatum]
MLKRNILAMSFAPGDNHEAQVQFALERRVPAVIGVLGSSRALDMPRRSRCLLIPWTSNGKWKSINMCKPRTQKMMHGEFSIVIVILSYLAFRCEGFSPYPRTYDLIHANGVFSLYENKCKFEDIHLEMDKTLRSEGAVIFRDDVDVINKVSSIAKGMRWDIKMVDDEHDDGPPVKENILVRLNSTGSVATEETVLSMTNNPFQQVILFTSKEITKFRPRYQPVIKVGK